MMSGGIRYGGNNGIPDWFESVISNPTPPLRPLRYAMHQYSDSTWNVVISSWGVRRLCVDIIRNPLRSVAVVPPVGLGFGKALLRK